MPPDEDKMAQMDAEWESSRKAEDEQDMRQTLIDEGLTLLHEADMTLDEIKRVFIVGIAAVKAERHIFTHQYHGFLTSSQGPYGKLKES